MKIFQSKKKLCTLLHVKDSSIDEIVKLRSDFILSEEGDQLTELKEYRGKHKTIINGIKKFKLIKKKQLKKYH